MATTIVTKYGSDAPAASDLVRGELAVDTENGRLYTENSSAAVVELGSKPSGNITFGDNGKAIFGAGSDLQIYHDGNHSYIEDAGTGSIKIKVGDFRVENASGNNLIKGVGDVATLHHAGSEKLATASTGIDVTGTVTTDGLTSAGDVAITGGSSGSTVLTLTTNALADTPLMVFQRTGGAIAGKLAYEDGNTAMAFGTTTAHELKFLTSNTERMQITSAGAVGIGTSSPAFVLDVNHASDNGLARFTSGDADAYITLSDVNSSSAYNKIGVITHDMYFNTNNAERMRIDSSGNVGMGTSSPVRPLSVKASQEQLTLSEGDSRGATFDYRSSTGNLNIATNGINARTNPQFTLDLNGNVGIGTDSPARTLHSKGASGISTTGKFEAGGSQVYIQLASTGQADGDSGYIGYDSSKNLTLFTVNTERMRIDSSGNLLVGTTDTTPGIGDTGAGVSMSAANGLIVSRSGEAPLNLNRNTDDGDFILFRRDGAGTAVGSIGAVSDDAYIVTGDTGIRFNDGNDGIWPVNALGAARDNAIDLGNSGVRFDDIYATNGTIQTSDRNEKQDIEALSDAEQRVAVAAKGLLRKFRWKSSVEEKGDDARTHFGIIAQDLQAAFEAEGLDAGDYAMFINSTWTDEETGEERSRMGVRYSELLAFIIAAI